jgi:succinyl-CoA synthetase beta subunit
MIADGIIQATKIVDLKKPLVVRLSGTNSDKGNKMLDEFAKSNP